jgi:tetratricopeptide (TPR) repeat protein
MKICVYAIALNESKFVKRWAKSAADADYLVVADTGSTDNTVELLQEVGAIVEKVDVKPWRFDVARNLSIDLIPKDADICICLDMDEVLVEGWRDILETYWTQNKGINRLSYLYYWAFGADGKPTTEYMAEKIHGRFSHTWTLPVHEILKSVVPEVRHTCPHLLIEHHADNSKSRAQYLSLLKLSVIEQPDNDRNSHYLGREYFFYKHFNEAITELNRHLTLPTATWPAERAASMRYIAKSYSALNDDEQAELWFTRAILEDMHSKEALIDLAQFLLARDKFYGAYHYAKKALEIDQSGPRYLDEAYAQREGPDDIMAVASYHLKMYSEALHHAQKAVLFNSHDDRLKATLRFAMEKV